MFFFTVCALYSLILDEYVNVLRNSVKEHYTFQIFLHLGLSTAEQSKGIAMLHLAFYINYTYLLIGPYVRL